MEKSVSINVPMSAGKLRFERSGDDLSITVLDTDGDKHDSATLSEADLRSIVKDLFPAKRKPREANAAATANGSGRRRRNEVGATA
jgi:hypothetical protein